MQSALSALILKTRGGEHTKRPAGGGCGAEDPKKHNLEHTAKAQLKPHVIDDCMRRVAEMVQFFDHPDAYVHAMDTHGLDSLTAIATADMTDFAAAGVKPAHRRKLVNYARERVVPPMPPL